MPSKRDKSKRKGKRITQKMKENYESPQRKRTTPLKPGDTVWLPENKSEGTVIEQSNTRSYAVRVQDGTIRRNRRDLIALSDSQDAQETDLEEVQRKESESHEPTIGVETDQTENNVKTRSG